MSESAPERPSTKFFLAVKKNAVALVQPHLVAIYELPPEPKEHPVQVGTGFKVRDTDCVTVLTAKHVLYGHDGSENPGDKAIFTPSGLKKLGELRLPEVASVRDLAAFRVAEFPLSDCLPLTCLSPTEVTPLAVSLVGYLARDFRRDAKSGFLRPATRIYTNTRVDYASGYVAFKHPKARNIATDTGVKVTAPDPGGMSGGPMLDSEKLTQGELCIVGIFTDYLRERALAVGECSWVALDLLRSGFR